MRKYVKVQLSGKRRTGAVSKALHHRNKRMQPIASSQQEHATNRIIATRECNQSHHRNKSMQPIASSQQENATNRVTVFNCSSVERKYVFIIHEPVLFTF